MLVEVWAMVSIFLLPRYLTKLQRKPRLNRRVITGQCYFGYGNHSFIYPQSELMTYIWFGSCVNGQIFQHVSKNNLPPNTTIINFISSFLLKDFVSAIIQSLSYFLNSPSLENHILANKMLFHAHFYSNPLTSTSPSSCCPFSLPVFI